MTPERFVYVVLGFLAIVLAVFLLIWIVNELDDETVDGAMIQLTRLSRGWCRGW